MSLTKIENEAIEMLKLLMVTIDRGHGEVWQVRCSEEYQQVKQWVQDNLDDG